MSQEEVIASQTKINEEFKAGLGSVNGGVKDTKAQVKVLLKEPWKIRDLAQ